MPARKKVSFASFNLYNINLPTLQVYSDKDGWDQDTYDKKVKWTGALISKLAVDAWGFQELWHEQALKDVFNHSGLTNDYELLIPPNHTGQKIVCAGAVKKNILVSQPEWIEDFPPKFILQSKGDDTQTTDISVKIEKFSRPVLHYKIRPRADGKAFSVYVVHFKSKGPTRIYREGWYRADKDYYSKHGNALGAAISTIRRTAEATALRLLLTEEMKKTGTPVVVLGDCNDSQFSNTLNILTEQPKYLLPGQTGGRDTALYSTGTLQEYRSFRDVYYTHVHENIKESLDHILVSEEFYDNSKNRIWMFKNLEIINDHLNTDKHKEDGTSDHGVVKATFEYWPAK